MIHAFLRSLSLCLSELQYQLNKVDAGKTRILPAGAFCGRDGSRLRVWWHSSAATPMRRTLAAASSPPAHEEPAHLAGSPSAETTPQLAVALLHHQRVKYTVG